MTKLIKSIILLPLLIILISGCTNIEDLDLNPQDLLTLNTEINSYLTDHPTAEISLKLFTEEQMSDLIEDVRTDCNNPNIEVKKLYRVTVKAEETKDYLVGWIDPSISSFLCVKEKTLEV
ncbi:MAG: hypothetical protein ABIJ92_01185 [Candidatus Aenigmatarchaeota archaeon]